MKALIYTLLLVLSSCSSPQSDYSIFPREEYLIAQTVAIDSSFFRYPFRIQVNGDTAIVMDLHGIEYFYHIFHFPEFRHISSFGKRGESPQEMLSADNVRFVDGSIWTLDANKSELTRLGYSESSDSILRMETVSLDRSLLRVLDFAVYNDSTFIVPDYSGESRFCWIDKKGKLLHKTGVIPTRNAEKQKSATPALAQAWRSFIDYNPRNNILAAVTQLGEVLEIFNLKDSTHIIRFGPGGEPEFKVADGYGIPTGIMGFSDVKVTDRAIYAVFHGRSFKEVAQQKEKVDGGQYIYVFSLLGEPLCKYVLDRYIYGIHVDEEKKIITATDVNSDQPIVKFRIG